MWDLGKIAYPSAEPFEKILMCLMCLCRHPKMLLEADTSLTPSLQWHHHFSSHSHKDVDRPMITRSQDTEQAILLISSPDSRKFIHIK